MENDSIRFIGGADDSYTQGMQLHVTQRKPWGFLKKPIKALTPCGAEAPQSHWSLGQTIFTPHNIITYSPPAGDRAFAGFLWFGFSTSLTRLGYRPEPLEVEGPLAENSPPSATPKGKHDRRVSLELDLGLIGPYAQGHTAQSAFHVLRESRIPKGWSHELGHRPQIGGLLRLEDRFFQRRCDSCKTPKRWFDVTSDVRVALGTMQTYGALGATARLSLWNLPGFPANPIPYSIDRSAAKGLRFALVGGGEARGVAHNAFLGDDREIEREHMLTEWRFGIEFSLREWQLSYLQINRSREFKSPHPELPGAHSYAAIELRRGIPISDPSTTSKALRGLRANLRLGRGKSTIEPSLPVKPELSLAASGGLEFALPHRFAFAYEKTGVVREGGSPGSLPCEAKSAPCHRDLFMLGSMFTAGLDLLPSNSRMAFQLRGGGGPSTLKEQEIPDTGSSLEPKRETFISKSHKARGWLAGGRLSWRAGAPVSVALDGAWTRLSPKEGPFTKSSYWTATLGIQIHPFGRDRTPKAAL